MKPGSVMTVLFGAMLGACAPTPPNVLLIIVDDLGWADTGTYGSSFYDTPNIDRLAASGVVFTDFYTAGSVCSPTRASLMTGRHPARLNITNWIGGEQQGQLLQAEYDRQLPLDEFTVGEMFKQAGYATGFIGKWHLGADGFHPEQQGFDVNIGGHEAGQPGSYFFPYENPNFAISNVPDLDDGSPGEHLTDRLTDESLAFIAEHAEDPFFLVMSYYAVHTPLEAKPELEAHYEQKAATTLFEGPEFAPEKEWGTTRTYQRHATYAGMIRTTDDNIGRIMVTLDSLGLDDRTIVVFVSDNGGLSTLMGDRQTAPTSNRPLRAGKGWLYEGGIRAPLIIRTPGLASGRTSVPASSNDVLPTLAGLAGIDPPDVPLDGVDLSIALEGGPVNRTALYWHFPHYHGSGNRPSGAIRRGNLKLIEWFETGDIELYDLERDIDESTDLSRTMPDSAQSLLNDLTEWRSQMDAQLNAPNPNWTGN